jgi:acyl-CoA thioesterase
MDAQDLTRDTAVRRLAAAPGWYTADLPHAWDFRTPSGGVLMTVAMRAMQAELDDPALRPISANTHFCSPVPAGPLEVRVEVLRKGNAAARVAQLVDDGARPGARGQRDVRPRPRGIDLLDATPPGVPSPEETPEMRGGDASDGHPPFFANFDTRIALGRPWWTQAWKPGDPPIVRWFRYLRPQRLPDGHLDPLALPPICDTMPPALTQRLGPSREPFFAPSLDLTIHFLEDTTSQWLMTHVHTRRARAGFATGEVEVWDDAGRLVALAIQMMMIRRAPGGEPLRDI